jgi:hypothetical protein
MSGPHHSHVTRYSDASTYDEICVNCGATDQVPGGWGKLVEPCTFKGPNSSGRKLTENQWQFSMRLAGKLCTVTLDINDTDCTEAEQADLFKKLSEL